TAGLQFLELLEGDLSFLAGSLVEALERAFLELAGLLLAQPVLGTLVQTIDGGLVLGLAELAVAVGIELLEHRLGNFPAAGRLELLELLEREIFVVTGSVVEALEGGFFALLGALAGLLEHRLVLGTGQLAVAILVEPLEGGLGVALPPALLLVIAGL